MSFLSCNLVEFYRKPIRLGQVFPTKLCRKNGRMEPRQKLRTLNRQWYDVFPHQTNFSNGENHWTVVCLLKVETRFKVQCHLTEFVSPHYLFSLCA